MIWIKKKFVAAQQSMKAAANTWICVSSPRTRARYPATMRC